MTEPEATPKQHVHQQKDYSVLDGLDLSAEMLDSILTSAENGLPITREQSAAMAGRAEGVSLMPRLGVRHTKAQADAFFGGQEKRLSFIRWFTAAMLPHTIQTLREQIAAGKRYQRSQNGGRSSLRLMLAMAEQELELLKTINLSLVDIEKKLVKTKYPRTIYLLPRLGELTLHTPHSVYPVRFCTLQQKDGLTFYHFIRVRKPYRWRRMTDTEFEYIRPEQQPAVRKSQTSAETSKKRRKPKKPQYQYRLAFNVKPSISLPMHDTLGEQARLLVNEAAVNHRASLRERMKNGEYPNAHALITHHQIETPNGQKRVILASYISKHEWKRKGAVKLWLYTFVASDEELDEILDGLTTLNDDWDRALTG